MKIYPVSVCLCVEHDARREEEEIAVRWILRLTQPVTSRVTWSFAADLQGPYPSHEKVIIQTLEYLTGTRHRGLTYAESSEMVFTAFASASLAGD